MGWRVGRARKAQIGLGYGCDPLLPRSRFPFPDRNHVPLLLIPYPTDPHDRLASLYLTIILFFAFKKRSRALYGSHSRLYYVSQIIVIIVVSLHLFCSPIILLHLGRFWRCVVFVVCCRKLVRPESSTWPVRSSLSPKSCLNDNLILVAILSSLEWDPLQFLGRDARLVWLRGSPIGHRIWFSEMHQIISTSHLIFYPHLHSGSRGPRNI
jgi:hypothetical protein